MIEHNGAEEKDDFICSKYSDLFKDLFKYLPRELV